MATTVKLMAPAPFAQFQTFTGAQYVAGSDGLITAALGDVQSLIASGCTFAISRHAVYSPAQAPGVSSTNVTVTSTTLGTGTLTIAVQPDVARQLQIIAAPNSVTLTAGSVSLTYIANDGTTQTDTFSMAGLSAAAAAGVAGATTFTTSKGVERIVSTTMTVSTPASTTTIAVGTNNYIAVPLDAGFVDWALTSEKKVVALGTFGVGVGADETVSTNTVSTGLVSPTTAPTGTTGYTLGYNFFMPS